VRRATSIVLLALAAVAAAPFVAADTCLPTCDVTTAAMRFFVPQVSVVTTGSTLSWLSGDGFGHTATDLATGCFHADFGSVNRGTVLFFVAEGALFAASEGKEPEACENAALPDGTFRLDYTCLLHPEMKAAILVH
jgi:plastocyanin